MSDSNSTINAAIIGLGKMGILHTGILNSLDNVNVIAFVEKEKFMLKAIEKYFPTNTYSNHEKMLDNENPDVVYIATPISTHIEIANNCIDKGINFFLEKPISNSYYNCLDTLDKLESNKSLINMIGYCKRFIFTFNKAKEIISNNILGKPIFLNSYMYVSQLFSKGKGWRYKKKDSGGGSLIGIACHLVDLLIWYFGEIIEVTGNTKKYYSNEVEDFANSYLEFKNGLSGTLATSWSKRDFRLLETKIEIEADNGLMIISDDYIKLYLDQAKKDYNEGWTNFKRQDLYHGVEIELGGSEYTIENAEMINSIRNNVQTSINFQEGLKSQKAIEAIYKSSNEKRTISLDEV